MEQKHDLVLNLVANPDYSVSDLATLGFGPTNIKIDKKEDYYKNSLIQENFKTEDGQFDKEGFDKYYNSVQEAYNYMSDINTYLWVKKRTEFDHFSIFDTTPTDQITPDYQVVQMPNPTGQSRSTYEFGKLNTPTKSIEEIAQTQQVVDPNTGIKYDSPNDSWWGHFGHTLVLASYDEDGTHIDPFTGQTVEHKKGDFKYNEYGKQYYEFLNGRDVNGKVVLNKLNVLTTDGSWANQFDFFDSDGLGPKSVGATLMKNLVLIGSMFLPVVGPWVAGASMLLNVTRMGAIIGKMVTGSDSPILNEIEGWTTSLDRQHLKTQYDMEHPFSLTSFIDVTADLMGQLKEQRAIFEYLPGFVLGNKVERASTWGRSAKYAQKANEEVQNKFLRETAEKYRKEYMTSLKAKRASKGKGQIYDAEFAGAAKNAVQESQFKAQVLLNNYMKDYQKIGEMASKVYMAGLISTPLYGEAKQAGVGDIEASLLVLGRWGAEMGLLMTPLGNYIFPELRAGRLANKAVLSQAVGIGKDKNHIFSIAAAGPKNASTPRARMQWAKKILGLGAGMLDRAAAVTTAKTFKDTFAASLVGGFETGLVNDIEEFLSDMTRSLHNASDWIRGIDDHHMNAWDNMAERYGMGMASGLVGGTLTQLHNNYTTLAHPTASNFDQAWRAIVHMDREGQTQEFLRLVENTDIASRDLSATQYHIDDLGNTVWHKANSYEDSQDYEVKKMLKTTLGQIHDIIEANGCDKSDQSFLTDQLLKEMRWHALISSKTGAASKLLREYNSVCADLAKTEMEIRNKLGEFSDEQLRTDEGKRQFQDSIKALDIKRAELLKKKDLLVSGELAPQFLREAYLEMSPNILQNFVPVNFLAYAEVMTGKKFNEIDDKTKEQLNASYQNYINAEKPDHIALMADLLLVAGQNMSETLTQNTELYHKLAQSEEYQKILQLNSMMDPGMMALLQSKQDSPEEWTAAIQEQSNSWAQAFLSRYNQLFEPDSLFSKEFIAANEELQKASLLKDAEAIQNAKSHIVDLINREIFNKVSNVVDKLEQLGWANTEVKQTLSRTLDTFKQQITGEFNILQQIWNDDGIADFTGLSLQEGIDLIKNNPNLMDLYFNNPESLAEPLLTLAQTLAQSNNDANYLLSVYNSYMQVKDLDTRINALDNSPIRQMLDQLSLAVKGERSNISELLEDLNNLFKESLKSDVTTFTLAGEELEMRLANARSVVSLFRSVLEAAKTDTLSGNNLVGYNNMCNLAAKKAGVEGWIELAEMKKNDADVFLSDLASLLQTLDFYQELYAANKAQKLSKQHRVGLTKDKVFYKRAKSYFNSIKDDFPDAVGISELIEALDNSYVIKNAINSETKALNEEDSKKAFEQNLRVQDAIYDFFNANNDKLQNLLSQKYINLFSEDCTLLTEDTQSIDDSSFLWWLASRTAVKASDFYSEYKEIIQTEGLDIVAPIPTLEMSVYLNYAAAMNQNVLAQFADIAEQNTQAAWKAMSLEARKSLLETQKLGKEAVELISASDNYTVHKKKFLFDHLVMSEGVPGSGKSNGVLRSVIKLIQTHPESGLLKNVAVIHGSGNADSAQSLLTSIKLPENAKGVALDKVKFLKSISPEYSAADNLNNITLSSEGKIIPTKAVVDSADNGFSIIIIDEVTNMSFDELAIINEYCKRNGVICLTAGDFDQTSISVSGKNQQIARGLGLKADLQLNLDAARTSFITAPKLGVSMRTANTQKDSNNVMLMTWITSVLDALRGVGSMPPPLTLRYFSEGEVFTGDCVLQTSELATTAKANTLDEYYANAYGNGVLSANSSLGKTIAHIFKSAGDDKVGFIGISKTSPLYKYLLDNYAGKFDEFIDKSALGREAKYYIIEPGPHTIADKPMLSTIDYAKNIYTGLTRASEGSLLINADATLFNNVPHYQLQENSDSNSVVEKFDDASLARFSSKVKAIYDSVIMNPSTVQFVSGKKVSSTGITATPPVTPVSATTSTTPETPAASTTASPAVMADSPESISTPETPSTSVSTEVITTQETTIEEEPEIKAPIVSPLGNAVFDEKTGKWTFVPEEIPAPETSYMPTVFDGYLDALDLESFAPVSPNPSPKPGPIPGGNVIGLPMATPTVNIQDNVQAASDNTVDDSTKLELERDEVVAESPSMEPENILSVNEEVLQNNVSPTANTLEDRDPFKETKNSCNIFYNTFNSFETSVPKPEKGLNETYNVAAFISNGINKRSDNFYGVARLYDKMGLKKFTYKDAIELIQKIRTACFTANNSSELQLKLNEVIAQKCEPIIGKTIPVNFALIFKQCPGAKQASVTFSNTEYNTQKFDKDYDNNHLHGIVSETEYKSIPRTISIIIADSESDFMEFPLVTLENPFTAVPNIILDHINKYETPENKLAYTDLYNNIDTHLALLNTDNFVPISNEIIAVLEEFKLKTGSAEFDEIKLWFDLWTHDTNARRAIRINKVPREMFSSVPPVIMSVDRSDYTSKVTQYRFKVQPRPLSEVINTQQVVVSPIYETTVRNSQFVLKDGTVLKKANGDPWEFKAGRPFILFSFDKSLDRNALFQLFIKEQLDHSLPPTVGMGYVQPPQCSVEDYIQELHKRYTGDKTAKPFGSMIESYKLLNILFNDEDFMSWVNTNAASLSLYKTQKSVTNMIDYVNDFRNQIQKIESDAETKLKSAENEALRNDIWYQAYQLKKLLFTQAPDLLYFPEGDRFVVPSKTNHHCLENILQTLFYTNEYTAGTETVINKVLSEKSKELFELLNNRIGSIYYQPSVFKNTNKLELEEEGLVIYKIADSYSIKMNGKNHDYNIVGEFHDVKFMGPIANLASNLLDAAFFKKGKKVGTGIGLACAREEFVNTKDSKSSKTSSNLIENKLSLLSKFKDSGITQYNMFTSKMGEWINLNPEKSILDHLNEHQLELTDALGLKVMVNGDSIYILDLETTKELINNPESNIRFKDNGDVEVRIISSQISPQTQAWLNAANWVLQNRIQSILTEQLSKKGRLVYTLLMRDKTEPVGMINQMLNANTKVRTSIIEALLEPETQQILFGGKVDISSITLMLEDMDTIKNEDKPKIKEELTACGVSPKIFSKINF